MSKIIYLTKGYQAVIDNDDYEKLIKFKWCASPHSDNLIYAKRGSVINGRYFNIYMHRQIMGLTPLSSRKIIIDHIDNNSLNNRKKNLRSVTHEQNMRNPNNKNHRGNKVGVTQCGDKWRARITVNGKSIHLGLFVDKKDAIKVRQKAEKLFDKYDGEQVLQEDFICKDDTYYDIYYDKETSYKKDKTKNGILRFIPRFTAKHGYLPTLQEIANNVNIGVPTVLYHIKRMEQLGLVVRDAGKSRSIRLT